MFSKYLHRIARANFSNALLIKTNIIATGIITGKIIKMLSKYLRDKGKHGYTQNPVYRKM
jgi:hypothetical protein